MIPRIEPVILDSVFTPEKFEALKGIFFGNETSLKFDDSCSRYYTDSHKLPQLKEYLNLVVPLAKEVFKSDTLKPTYAFFVQYKGDKANLEKHRDGNACTYTLDLCLYQNSPWDLWVDNKPYTLQPNQALAYYGNDQEHWREEFPEKETNTVALVFFHFAEPDHWYFTKGPDYYKVLAFKENILRRRRELGKP